MRSRRPIIGTVLSPSIGPTRLLVEQTSELLGPVVLITVDGNEASADDVQD
ncbi:MAG: hypothetical protein VX589_00685 [Myxococcota bacterium]|nr:hypothetical protein [Myxococcota bacterium]